MDVSVRPFLAAGAAAITAATLTMPSSAPTPASPVEVSAVRLSAAVQPVIAQVIPPALAGALSRVLPTTAPAVTAAAQPVASALAFPGIGNAIKSVYNAVEPWVAWGVDVAAWAAGWVPFVGLLAPQIVYLYNFGEAIVQSVVFNFADWISGQVSFGQGVVNIANDSWNATVTLINTEIGWLLSFLPPFPPIPPIGLSTGFPSLPGALSVTAASATQGGALAGVVRTFLDNLSPTGLPSSTTLAAETPRRGTGFLERLGERLSAVAPTFERTFTPPAVTEVDTTGAVVELDVSAPAPRGPLREIIHDVADTARAARADAAQAAGSLVTAPRAGADRQDTAGGPVSRVTKKLRDAAAAGEARNDTRRTVVRDTVRNATQGVKKAGQGIRDALGARPSRGSAGDRTGAGPSSDTTDKAGGE